MSLLQLPSFKEISPMQENEHDMLFTVELSSPPSACPHCGCIANLYKHSNKKQFIMDMPIRMKRVAICVHRKRYKCRDCNSTFWEPMSEADETRKMTKRLKNYIEKQALNKTFTELAETVGVAEGTIRHVFNEYSERMERTHVFETPTVLGIDEIYVIKKPRLILTNIDERTIFDMVDNRKQENVIKRLEAIPDAHKVELVTMDMWAPYRRSVRMCMPNATIVVDKFHVVRMGNNALETVRKKVRTNASAAERKALMYDRKIMLKRNHELDERGLFLLDLWLNKFPDLKSAYELKESFYRIWDCPDRYDATMAYRNWLDDLKRASTLVQTAFKDIQSAFSNWGDEIFNYFDNRVTNAYTESLNSIIRKLDQSGRGYSFDVLRAKLLFNENLHKKRKPKFNSDAFMHMTSKGSFYRVEPEVDDSELVNYGVSFSTNLFS